MKKLGLSALAGSLVAFSANAADLSVSGGVEVTYVDTGGNKGNEVTGKINLSSEVLIEIKAKIAELNTKNNILRLHGDFKIENEKYQINGKEIFFNFEKGTILSNHAVTVLFPNWQIYGGKMEIYNSENSEKNLLFFINNGVKIKYLL